MRISLGSERLLASGALDGQCVGVVSNLLPSEVQAWMESEDLHRSQAPDGGLLICLNSLLKRVQKSRTI